ncbi:MAG: hypothetical protein B0W54_01565 [Cellvibrio sp. 79]|nr:MAG: hypothetical protein B0W54_01565 [Cellvibrio sp. 79]
MKKLISVACLSLVSSVSMASAWLVLTPAEIKNIQIMQAGNSHGSPEGLYIGLKTELAGAAATYCAGKGAVVITDPKLIDRAYSGLLFALSTQKTVQFYLDGPSKCVANLPQATMFTLVP